MVTLSVHKKQGLYSYLVKVTQPSNNAAQIAAFKSWMTL